MRKTVPLFGIYRERQMEDVILDVLQSGQIAAGNYVNKFTEGFGKLTCQDHIVTVNDMSNAIQIALRLSDVQPGDEVLTTSFACMSTNAPIASSGASPVWVDVNPATGQMDPDALVRSITSRSKAVIVYHLAGYPAEIEKIAEICSSHGLKLIEDCDNALLASVGNQQVGCFGDFAIFSFYPNRQLNASEGGALSCRRREDAERAIRLRRYGIDLNQFRDQQGEINPECDIPEIGWAATLNNMCSAMAYVQLDGVAHRIQRAREYAGIYRELLSQLSALDIVKPYETSVPSYWVFLVRVLNRDHILTTLKKAGIQASRLHYLNDRYSGFKTDRVTLPGTQDFFDHVLALPCGWWLTRQDVESVCSVLSQAVAGQYDL